MKKLNCNENFFSTTLIAKTWITCCLMFVLFSCFINLVLAEAPSTDNPFLKKYSRVFFDTKTLNDNHQRVKRSLDDHIKLSFESHGRNFKMELVPASSSTMKKYFNTDHVEISGGQKYLLNDIPLYEGKLLDEPATSYILGSIIDGIFVGTIESKNYGKYFLESSRRYATTDDETDSHHAVVYHEDDVNSAEQVQRARLNKTSEVSEDDLNSYVGCGLTIKKNRDRLIKEQENLANQSKRRKRDIKSVNNVENIAFKHLQDEYLKYTKERNSNDRVKRQSGTSQTQFPNSRSVCNLYLRADPLLYQTIYNKEGNRNDRITESFLISYFVQQVAAVNRIYNPTQFFYDTTNYYSGLSFVISRIKIYNINQCNVANSTLSSTEQLLCQKYLDPVTFLNDISLENYTDYCTAFTFTSRDYADGTLGLAWLATASTAVGGICEKPVSVSGVSKSLNSGMVTVVSFNGRTPDVVQHITFAHELGHNFGSTHDQPGDSTCAPGGSSGNYIMYSRATDGKSSNNIKFSPCSQKLIGGVLDYVVKSEGNCLKTVAETSGPICGNGIVDKDEECDYSVFNDICCTQQCTLAINPATNQKYVCSPSNGPCCNDRCVYKQNTEVCLQSTGCIRNVTCTGTSSTCPAQDPNNFLPDNSYCNDFTQVCKNGTCTGSLCDLVSGLKSCTLSGDLGDKNVDKSALCFVACTGAITGNVCRPTYSITGFSGRRVSLRQGSVCAGTQGYCDMFGVCRAVNQDTSFSRLLATILSSPSVIISDVKTWVKTYWWAILIFCLIFLALNGLLILCITRHLRSDNPEKNQSLSFKETLKSPFQVFRSRKNKSPENKRRRLRQDSIRPVARELAPNVVSDDYKLTATRSNRNDIFVRGGSQREGDRGMTRHSNRTKNSYPSRNISNENGSYGF